MKNEIIDKLKDAGYITVTDDSQGIADKCNIGNGGSSNFPSYLDIVINNSARPMNLYGYFNTMLITDSDTELAQYSDQIISDVDNLFKNLPTAEVIDTYSDVWDELPEGPFKDLMKDVENPNIRSLLDFPIKPIPAGSDLTNFVYGTLPGEVFSGISWPMEITDALKYGKKMFVLFQEAPMKKYFNYLWDYDFNVLSHTSNWSERIDWQIPILLSVDPSLPLPIPVSDETILKKILEDDNYNIANELSGGTPYSTIIDNVAYIVEVNQGTMSEILDYMSNLSSWYIDQIIKHTLIRWVGSSDVKSDVVFYDPLNYEFPGFDYRIDFNSGTIIYTHKGETSKRKQVLGKFLDTTKPIDWNVYKIMTLDPTGFYYYKDHDYDDESKRVDDPEEITKVLKDIVADVKVLSPHMDWNKMYAMTGTQSA